jgi:hypothetical protein
MDTLIEREKELSSIVLNPEENEVIEFQPFPDSEQIRSQLQNRLKEAVGKDAADIVWGQISKSTELSYFGKYSPRHQKLHA